MTQTKSNPRGIYVNSEQQDLLYQKTVIAMLAIRGVLDQFRDDPMYYDGLLYATEGLENTILEIFPNPIKGNKLEVLK